MYHFPQDGNIQELKDYRLRERGISNTVQLQINDDVSKKVWSSQCQRFATVTVFCNEGHATLQHTCSVLGYVDDRASLTIWIESCNM